MDMDIIIAYIVKNIKHKTSVFNDMIVCYVDVPFIVDKEELKINKRRINQLNIQNAENDYVKKYKKPIKKYFRLLYRIHKNKFDKNEFAAKFKAVLMIAQQIQTILKNKEFRIDLETEFEYKPSKTIKIYYGHKFFHVIDINWK